MPDRRARRDGAATEPVHSRGARRRGERARRRVAAAARARPDRGRAAGAGRLPRPLARGPRRRAAGPPRDGGHLPRPPAPAPPVGRVRQPRFQVPEQHRRARALGGARGLPARGARRRPRGVRQDARRRRDRARRGGARRAARRPPRAGGSALPHAAHRAGHAAHDDRGCDARAPACGREPRPPRRPRPAAASQGARHPLMPGARRSTNGGLRPATLIPGDGIGPEVIDAAVHVLEAAGGRIAWDVQIAGKAAFDKLGTPIPEPLLASIRRTRVALKGPLETQVGRVGYRSVNVALRKAFDLYANVRPIRSLPGVRTAFSDVDLIVVRENPEDLYSGIEHQIAPGVVESVKVITARASKRIARHAFELARREKRRKVVAIHKANIMKLSDGLFLACARQVAKRHPRIGYGELIVDNACMQLVLRPQEFDVLLLENLYGDIVSDLCAGLVGGLALGPGANVARRHAIFEAVHGTAPDIAGKNLANPLAAVLSGAMLLRHIGRRRAADRIERAVTRLLREGRTRTRDLGGSATTSAVADRLIALL